MLRRFHFLIQLCLLAAALGLGLTVAGTMAAVGRGFLLAGCLFVPGRSLFRLLSGFFLLFGLLRPLTLRFGLLTLGRCRLGLLLGFCLRSLGLRFFHSGLLSLFRLPAPVTRMAPRV